MKSILILAILISMCDSILTQSQFQYKLSGVKGEAYSIIQTTDGGYAIAGFSSLWSTGHGNLYIAKFNSYRKVQWSKILGSKYCYHYNKI